MADDFVQAISSDKSGNIYFGTKNGLSVFDGTKWKTYTVSDGLPGNNILTLAVDRNDCIWIGTDNGVTCLKDNKFISLR